MAYETKAILIALADKALQILALRRRLSGRFFVCQITGRTRRVDLRCVKAWPLSPHASRSVLFWRQKTEGDDHIDRTSLLLILARLGRFERPAYGSGGRHSIH